MAERHADAAEPADPTVPEPPHRRRTFREPLVLVLVALVLAFLIKAFLIQAFFIPSTSMLPTLRRGDRILVCRICLHLTDLERGDVLVFSDPHPPSRPGRGPLRALVDWLGRGIGIPGAQEEDFVKRVGALPGETWEIRAGQLIVDGRPVDEPYLATPSDTRSFGPQTVPDGMLLMLGDNRLGSADSRLSPEEEGLGYVPIDEVIGRAFVIVWPPSRIGGTG